jgi:hypothetical protein
MERFNQILRKVSRSHEILTILRAEIVEYMNENPFRFVEETNHEAREKICRARISKEIPLNIRIYAGEVITHLRSALDHLTWQLALINTDTPAKGTQFPIAAETKKFNSDQIRSLAESARSIIYELQPFHSAKPTTHPLWLLNKLANDDKHRLITVAYNHTQGMGIAKMPPTEKGDFEILSTMHEIHDGTEVWRIKYPDFKGDVGEISVVLFVGLCLKVEGSDQIMEIAGTLQLLGEHVETALKKFLPFFEKK